MHRQICTAHLQVFAIHGNCTYAQSIAVSQGDLTSVGGGAGPIGMLCLHAFFFAVHPAAF